MTTEREKLIERVMRENPAETTIDLFDMGSGDYVATDVFTEKQVRAILSAALSQPAGVPRRATNCQNGLADVCLASQRDGVICADDECDIDSGIRKLHAPPPPAAQQDMHMGRIEAMGDHLAAQQDGGALIESLHRLAEQWRANMGSKPSSRRIETYNKEFGRGEDDFDNEAFGVRRCATELERMLERHERLAAKDAAQQGSAEAVAEVVQSRGGGGYSHSYNLRWNHGIDPLPKGTKLYPHPARTDPAVLRDAERAHPLLHTARRNLRQFLGKASFSSSVDRWSAINCLDVIDAAIDAQAKGE